MVTLYHWDLPQPLQEIGGWTNEVLAEYFEDYASTAFSNFGDRVKLWLTLNEPWVQSVLGYGEGKFAPGIESHGIGVYLAAHTMLKAHGLAYRLYKSSFQDLQKGKIGISLDAFWMTPKTDSPDDKKAAEQAMQFKLGWFAHPIFSDEGDYPPIMKEVIEKRSGKEGRKRSRLPKFTPEWIELIRRSSDFFGLNHYTSYHAEFGEKGNDPSWERDSGCLMSQDDSWPKTPASWLRVVPWGFRELLKWIKMEYNNPEIIVTENGVADSGELNDTIRIDYYTAYINEMLKAVHLDGCNVTGYMAWSLLDNFEWTDGYTLKFGLHYVDFDDPKRPRTAKESTNFYKEIIKNHGFPNPGTNTEEL